ncbi:MAG: sodium:calcium symporter, partial [Flavobacteriales bacterium]|nr:sodium:calcium symporter [Flavobacteriales bacterium]
DYWAGTVSLVVFALAESILFAWIFGIDKGWRELLSGSDLQVPTVYKFIIKYITPLMLLLVFLGALFTPIGNDWTGAFQSIFSGGGWTLDNASIFKTIANSGLHQQLAAATDPAEVVRLKDRLFYTNFARILLCLTFFALALLVYLASVRRMRTSTPSAGLRNTNP